MDYQHFLGYAAGKNKNGKLVEKALYSIKYNLQKIDLFHSNRGSELKMKIMKKH